MQLKTDALEQKCANFEANQMSLAQNTGSVVGALYAQQAEQENHILDAAAAFSNLQGQQAQCGENLVKLLEW